MPFEDEFEKFEQNPNGQVISPDPEEKSTESVENTSASEDTKAPEGEQQIPPAEQKETIPPVPPASTETQQPDYNKFLEESSGGLFKSVDDFKASLPKIQGYDAIEQQRADYENKYNGLSPFAKKYDEMVKSGKTKEALDSFVKINQLGELSDLDPFQMKVEALVQDGYARSTAERKVTKQFGLDVEIEGEHLSPEEIEINKQILADNKEDLKISALKDDLPKLQGIKAQLEDTKDLEAKNKTLAEAAQIKEYQEKLKPVTTKIAQEYTGIGRINVNGGEGDKAVFMDFNADDEYKQQVQDKLFDYFKDGSVPVNEQTVTEAKEYLDAVYFARNKEKLFRSAYNQGVADAKESATQEFENKSGLPTSGLPPVTRTAAQSLADQQRKAALGEDDD